MIALMSLFLLVMVRDEQVSNHNYAVSYLFSCGMRVTLKVQGHLALLLCSLELPSCVNSICSSFCLLPSPENGEFIDYRPTDLLNMKFLAGHGSLIIRVAWNHGENLVASSDSDVIVIVWKLSNQVLAPTEFSMNTTKYNNSRRDIVSFSLICTDVWSAQM
ncbi:uncharacterized protein [Elaeis guineensis]|uniref:uncharacterized protein isoform X2 n=1 Tax=Elaeis guineensis var. tenera TaxID=51953 RepID=UPI003C6D7BB9